MSFPRIVLLCYVIYLFWVAQLQITLYWQSEPDDGSSDQKAETEICDFIQQIPVRPVLTADNEIWQCNIQIIKALHRAVFQTVHNDSRCHTLPRSPLIMQENVTFLLLMHKIKTFKQHNWKMSLVVRRRYSRNCTMMVSQFFSKARMKYKPREICPNFLQ